MTPAANPSVIRWLSSLGLLEHAQAFEENAITPDVLPTLTEDDLVELGVTSAEQRAKLLAACRQPLDELQPVAEAETPHDAVTAWLQRLGCAEFAPVFSQNAITAELVPALTDEELRELGVADPAQRSLMLMRAGEVLAVQDHSGTEAGDASAKPIATSIPQAAPGRYTLVRPLGKGGFGQVSVARDTALHREVALKRLLSTGDATQPDGLEVFAREATALASLSHPNIVQLFDFARDDEGVFIIMELLQGRTLDATMNGTPLRWEEFVQLVRQSLQALAAAHHAGILHRDIKPENLFLQQQASGGWTLKMLDFGLAKFHRQPRPETSEQTGMVAGSIHFMAPEQLRSRPLGPATDLYALGCVFYWVLSRQHAFSGATMAEVIDAHVQHRVVPLAQRVPGLPAAVTAWVMRLIAVEPEHRPAGAAEALREFDEALLTLQAAPAAQAPASAVKQPLPANAKPTHRTAAQRKPAKPGKPVARPASPMVPQSAPPKRTVGGWVWLIIVILCAALLPLSAWHFWQKRQAAVKPTATAPAPRATSGDTLLVLSSKDARLNGRSLLRASDGDIGSWTNMKETISWSVQVPAAGSYTVELTYALPTPGNGTVISITGGSKPLDVTVKATGKDWYAYKTTALGTIAFAKAGPATLTLVPKVKRTTGVMNVRSLKLSKSTK